MLDIVARREFIYKRHLASVMRFLNVAADERFVRFKVRVAFVQSTASPDVHVSLRRKGRLCLAVPLSHMRWQISPRPLCAGLGWTYPHRRLNDYS